MLKKNKLTCLSSYVIYPILKMNTFLAFIHQDQFLINPMMANLIQNITDHC